MAILQKPNHTNWKITPVRPFAPIAAYGLAAALMLAPAAQAQITKVPAEVKAGVYNADPGHTKVTWSLSHFGFSTYVGQFAAVKAVLKVDPKAPEAADLQVTIDTASVGTLNSALDTHLKSADFLDVTKFPTATFKSTSVKSTGAGTADVTGDLTLHGVTKPVTLQVTFTQGGVNPINKAYQIGFQAKTVLKRSEFGIKTYAPALGDDVTLQIDTEMKAAS